jgi:hypothetical protein
MELIIRPADNLKVSEMYDIALETYRAVTFSFSVGCPVHMGSDCTVSPYKAKDRCIHV